MPAMSFSQIAGPVFAVIFLAGSAQANPASLRRAADSAVADTAIADEATGDNSDFDNLEMVDASLTGIVAVSRVGSAVAENNLLSVFAGLKNKTEHRVTLEIETIYKDNAGNALNNESWIVVTLKPHEDKNYRSSSISEDAVDFLIRIRQVPQASSRHGAR